MVVVGKVEAVVVVTKPSKVKASSERQWDFIPLALFFYVLKQDQGLYLFSMILF